MSIFLKMSVILIHLDKMRLKAYNINDSPKQISKINGREREKKQWKKSTTNQRKL